MRGAVRRPSRGSRKKRPRMVKGLLRIGTGAAILYLTAGTNRGIKLLRDDVQRIEDDTRKHVEEMEEEELELAMERLGIKSGTLTDDEQQIVRLASKYVLAGYFILGSEESTS